MSVVSCDVGTWSLLGFDKEDSVVTVPLAMTDLQSTRHLFVRKMADDRLDGKNGFTRYYDIMGSSGLRIFQGIERTPQEHRKAKGQKNFYVVIFDAQGNEVMHFHGQIGKIYEGGHLGVKWGGVFEKLYHEQRFIYPIVFHRQDADGQKHKQDLKSTKNRKPINSHGVMPGEILYIVTETIDNNAGCCGCQLRVPEDRMRAINLDVEANIYLPDRITKVGRISKSWNSNDLIKCNPNDLINTMGVQFPKRTDLRIKATLLGSLFMLNYGFLFRIVNFMKLWIEFLKGMPKEISIFYEIISPMEIVLTNYKN